MRTAITCGTLATTLACALAAAPTEAASLCSVSNVTAVTFDTLTGLGRPGDARATFVVTCPRTQAATILLLYSHHMKGARGEDLTYDLYSTTNHAAIWGSGADGAPVSATFAAGQPTTMYVYARVQAGQRPASGRFTDDVVIEVLSL